MAFIAPLIGAALGLGAVGTAVLEVGLAVGLSFAAKKLRPKQKTSDNEASRGVRVGLTISAKAPRQVIFGEVATGGSLAYWQLSGTNNDVLHMIIPLADHECTSLQGVLVNGKFKSWNSSNGQVAGYGSKLIVRFKSGAAGQTADSEVIAASDGRWTANDVGVGVCYAVVKLTYDEELFPEGIPELGFIVRGAKLYDPRNGTTAYSNNAAIVLYNLLRGISAGGEPLAGMNVPASAIRLAEAQAAANACAESVGLKGGGTEARYSCNVIFDATQSNRDMIETVLASMAGELIATGGVYRMLAGVAQSPVATLTDDDFIVTEPMVVRPKKGRNELTNAILGSYIDPSRGYTPVPLPARTSSTDESIDGGFRYSRTIDLSGVTSRAQAQRVLEIERKRARRMTDVGGRLRARHFGLEPGDWVTLTSARRGFSSKTFVLHTSSGRRDLASDIVLVEIDDQFDDWVASTDEISDNQVIDLKSAGPSLSAVSGVSVLNVNVPTTGGVQRPGLQMQWTPITDLTVVQLQIQFRKTGDTAPLPVPPVLDPSEGSYTWISGVQSGAAYEARVRPITRPQRGTTWSSWIAATGTASDQVVPLSVIATAVPPDTVTPAMLSAQARLELSLITEVDSVVGSISGQIKALSDLSDQAHLATIQSLITAEENKAQIRSEKIERVAEDLVLAQQITTISAQINTSILAAIQEEQTARATADGTLAQQIATAVTRLDGNELAVTVLSQSVNGLEGRFGIAINANGQVVGLVQLDGSAVAGSTFTVVADKFTIAQPGVAGGSEVPIFAIANVNGTAKLAFRGDMFADGSINVRSIVASSLSALSANLGTVTAGLIRDPQNTYFFNVASGQLGSVSGRVLFDMKNERLRMGG